MTPCSLTQIHRLLQKCTVSIIYPLSSRQQINFYLITVLVLKEPQILHHTDLLSANHVAVLPTALLAVTCHLVWHQNELIPLFTFVHTFCPLQSFTYSTLCGATLPHTILHQPN